MYSMFGSYKDHDKIKKETKASGLGVGMEGHGVKQGRPH